jgi:hypothetical protein
MNQGGKASGKRAAVAPGSESLVGIFWCYRGRLLKAAVRVADGLNYGDAVHSRVDHVRFWPELQKSIPALRDRDYEMVPRGRVVFHSTEDRFCVYMDKKLHTERVKRLLLAEFYLPSRRTRFLTDPHYTTDPRDLERLFEG